MKAPRRIFISTLLLLAFFGFKVEAYSVVRDFSGDAMQRFDSRMLESPLMRFPAVLGTSHWPFIAYPPAPNLTFLDIQIQIPELNQAPTPLPKPPASPQFWIARCGVFVQFDMSSTMNLMEEEAKACAP